ncbi:MAG: FAD-dependent oxidoreductase [Planctomycetota bacterium]|nr:FAD-dependent oxidoreductase [Planctomycetota bacterium]
MDESNKPLRIVVVGGVAGGASAATRARRVNAMADITLLERNSVVSFANCGLPYHVGGEIEKRQSLIVAKKELFWNRFRIHVKTDCEAVKIDRVEKWVHILDRVSGVATTLPYDRLILATGAEPNVPDYCVPMPANAFHLWTLADMDGILAKLAGGAVTNAVVIGGGFVGLEVVEQLHRRGVHVTLVERNPQILTRLDRVFAKMVENHIASKSVDLELGNPIVSLKQENGIAVSATLKDGRTLPLDLLIVGAGVRPRTQLASECGLNLGNEGGIDVNDVMQTSDPNIYAVGDIVEYRNGVTGKRGLNPLAGPANRSGRIAGKHAATGHSEVMGPVLGTSIVRVFDLTAACTGLNERALAANGIEFRTAIIQAAHHASYFPGSESMQLKILYSPKDGKLLGAQAVGGDGVDKRIDILATALHFGGTVFQLAQLDLAYAPPYGSAKDPIHMAAFAACNDLNGTPVLALPNADLTGMQIVDVRTASEREKLPLPGAIAIEVDDFPPHISELDPERATVVVCHSGKRAHVAASWLRSSGFKNVSNLTGGMAIRSLIDHLAK